MSINQIFLAPNRTDELIVCDRSPFLTYLTFKGQKVKTLTQPFKENNPFVCASLSARCGYLYVCSEDHSLFCFDLEGGGKMVHRMKVHGIRFFYICVHLLHLEWICWIWVEFGLTFWFLFNIFFDMNILIWIFWFKIFWFEYFDSIKLSFWFHFSMNK